MELNGVQIEKHGSGYALTLRLWAAKEEELGKYLGSIFGNVMAAAGLSPDSDAGAPAEENPTSAAPPAESQGGRRRRRTASSSESAPEAAESAPSSTGGRRRRSSAAADESPTEEAAPSAGGGKGRRGRRAKASALAESAASPTDDVTDADLTKACSQAGAVVGPAGVMEMLQTEFGVAKVSDLDDARRAECLVKLQEMTDA